MKNKFTARLAAAMCLVIVISSFAACSIKEKTDNPTSAPIINPADDNWFANGMYEPVTITNVELVQLVNDALGSEAAGWDGNLGSLSSEQLQKVEQAAQDKGLIIEKDEGGNTVIKTDEIPTTQATPEEVTRIQNVVSVQDMSNVSPSQFVELSKVAAQNNMAVVTKPGTSEVVIVKPAITRPVQQTPPQGGVATPPPASIPAQQTPSQGANNPPLVEEPPKYTPTPNKTEKPAVQGTTSVYVPAPNKPVETIAPTKTPVPTFSSAWVNTVSNAGKDSFNASEVFEKGVVSVGISLSNGSSKSKAYIVANSEKGKQLWSHIIEGNDTTTFEDVTVLNDGSIIAVGYTSASEISGFTDADFRCKGTTEGIVVKFDKNGDIVWRKTVGGSAGDMLYSVTATPDGGFVMGGKSFSSDADLKDIGSQKIKAFFIKSDANGNIQWRQGLSGTKHSAVVDLTSNSSGDIYGTIECVCGDGEYASIEGTKNAKRTTVVAKLNSAGQVVWAQCFRDSGRTELFSIETASDGGCVIAGQFSTNQTGKTEDSFKDFHSSGTPGTYDCMVIKMAPDGKVSWMTQLIGFESDYIESITKVNGGYAVVGYTTSSNRDFPVANKGDNDIFIYTLNDYGTKKNVYSLGGSSSDNSHGICSDGNSSVYISGSTNSGDGYFAECSAKGSEGMTVGFVARFELN